MGAEQHSTKIRGLGLLPNILRNPQNEQIKLGKNGVKDSELGDGTALNNICKK